MTKTGLGQDSHAFEQQQTKPLILGGVVFAMEKSLKGNSDADVILHALTRAISSITGNDILAQTADKLCQQGITDSAQYLALALKDLQDWQITHIAISIECSTPKIAPHINAIKSNIARLVNTAVDNIGITATTGDGLTAFGRGCGIQVFSIISVIK